MKLANSAYFGMRGRVASLQFAVTGRRLHDGADDGDRRPGQPRRRVAAARGLLGEHDEPRAGRLDAGARASASAPRTRCASVCWPRWAPRCCTTTTPRATPTILAEEADLPEAGGRRRRAGTASTACGSPRWRWSSGASRRRLTTPLNAVDDYQSMDGALLRGGLRGGLAADHGGLRGGADQCA